VKFAEKLGSAPAWLGPALVALPAAMTILGTATGAAVALGSTLATGGIAFAAYGAVAKGVITKAATASTAVEAAQQKYNAALKTGTGTAAAYLAEQKAINLAYAGMSPAQIALSRQLGDMSAQWSGVEKSLTPVVALSVAPWLGGITSAMKFAKPVVTDVSQAVSSLGSTFDALVNLPAFATFAKFIGTEGTDVISSGGGALMNFFHGFIILLPQVKPLIDDVDGAVAHLGSSFLTWSQSDAPRHDIQAFMSWLHDNGPVVGHLLLSIGAALKNLGGGFLSGPAGADEIRLLTGFFGLISRLPPSFVQPVADLAASLLLISKFGFGRKIISLGVNLVGTGLAKLWNLLTPGGSIDLTGKFSGAAAMQTAAETMVSAAAGMQKAADTMIGADAGAGGVAGAGGAAGAAEGAAGGAAAAEGAAAAKAETGILGLVGGLLGKVNPALIGLALSGDSGPNARQFSRSQLVGPGQTSAAGALSSFTGISASQARLAVSDVRSGQGTGNLDTSGIDPKMVAQIIRFTAANAAAAKAVAQLGSAEFAGKVPSTQFAGFLTAAGTSGLKAKTLTDEYTLAIQRNGTTSQAAQNIRARMISDFTHQGLSAQQADKLVDTYTDGVAANGNTTAAKARVRAQLIQDFINAGDTAKQAAAKVDTLIGQIANVRSKNVSLTVQASGSFKITEGQVVGPGGTRINAGPGTPGAAKGMFVSQGRPGVDDQLIMAQRGEVVVPTPMVRAGAVDHLRGKIPGFAGGGIVGSFAGSPSGLGAFDAREWAATQSLVEAADAFAAATAMKKAIAAAKASLLGGLVSGNAIVDFASQFVGKLPYVWGGTSLTTGADCSGFTEAVYAHFGIGIPRSSEAQFSFMQPSSDGPGRLVFFVSPAGGPPPGHVGISDGHGMMVNAAGTQFGTIVSSSGGNMGFRVPAGPATRLQHQLGAAKVMDSGGWLPPGLTLVDNRTGKSEHLTRDSGSQQGPGMADVTRLLSRLIGAVYDNAGMTADGVAEAIGAAASKSMYRSMHSPR
jgi:cell wall-associated NlpC family hydrolase